MELKLLLSSVFYFAGLNFICQFLAQLLSYFMSLCSSRSGLFLNNALSAAACAPFPAWPVFHLEFYHRYDWFGLFKIVLQTFLKIIYQKWQMSNQQDMWLLFFVLEKGVGKWSIFVTSLGYPQENSGILVTVTWGIQGRTESSDISEF